jgi:hypothetical protein
MVTSEGYEFDAATAVVSSGKGRWVGAITPGWDIGGNANGGYVLALAGRALRDLAQRPDPITVTAHYLAPAPAGPVEVTGSVVKAGKRFTTVTGSLVQDQREVLRVLATFGDVSVGHGNDWIGGPPPDLPEPSACEPRDTFNGAVPVPLMGRLDVRLAPTRDGSGVVEGWFGFADGRPADTLALLLAADAFPPAYFTLGRGAGWVPTVELTVHVRAVPSPGPLACRFTTRFVQGGFLEEDGEIWSSDGRLVALSRQMALTPRV